MSISQVELPNVSFSSPQSDALSTRTEYLRICKNPTFTPSERECLRAMLITLLKWNMPGHVLGAALASFAIKHGQEFPSPYPRQALRLARLFTELEGRAAIKDGLGYAECVKALRYFYYEAVLNHEVVLLALASHLWRMQNPTAGLEPFHTTLRIQNQLIYIPVAERLGLWDLRTEFGNLELQAWDSEKYRELQGYLDETRPTKEQQLAIIRADLESELNARKITGVEILLQQSSPGSIYLAELRKRSSQHGLLMLDIVAETLETCRALLPILRRWTERARPDEEFYLDQAKPNGFRGYVLSFHSDQFGSLIAANQIVVLFVYTPEMERFNRNGIIAALYPTAQMIHGVWWNDGKLRNFLAQRPPAEPLKSVKELYCFTPQGDVLYPLPEQVTALEALLQNHAKDLVHCKAIWLNGKPTGPETLLQNGDIVEAEIEPTYRAPLESWFDLIATDEAREILTRNLHRGTPIREQRDRIKRELGEIAVSYKVDPLRISDRLIDEVLELVAQEYIYWDAKGLLMDMDKSPSDAHRLIPSDTDVARKILAAYLSRYIINSTGEPMAQFCEFHECNSPHGGEPCRARAGEQIVAVWHKNQSGRVLRVFSKTCPEAPTGLQAIDLQWSRTYFAETMQVTVLARDRHGLVKELLHELLYQEPRPAIDLHELTADAINPQQARTMLTFSLKEKDAWTALEKRLETLEQQRRILRYTHSYVSWMPEVTDRNPYRQTEALEGIVFKGRHREFTALTDAVRAAKPVTWLAGPPRIGKTTVLTHLHREWQRSDRVIMVQMTCGDLDGENFWSELARHLVNTYRERTTNQKPALLRQTGRSSLTVLRTWLKEVASFLGTQRFVVILDEFTDICQSPEGPTILRDLHELIRQFFQNINFIFCVHLPFPLAVTRSALFTREDPIELDHLSRKDGQALIEEPLRDTLAFESSATEHLLAVTDSHPFYLQILMYELVNQADQENTRTITTALVERVIDTWIQQAHDYYFPQLLSGLLSSRQGLALRAVCEINERHPHPITADEIRSFLQARSYTTNELQVSRYLDALERATLLRRGPTDTFTLRIPLLGRWINLHQPFSR